MQSENSASGRGSRGSRGRGGRDNGRGGDHGRGKPDRDQNRDERGGRGGSGRERGGYGRGGPDYHQSRDDRGDKEGSNRGRGGYARGGHDHDHSRNGRGDPGESDRGRGGYDRGGSGRERGEYSRGGPGHDHSRDERGNRGSDRQYGGYDRGGPDHDQSRDERGNRGSGRRYGGYGRGGPGQDPIRNERGDPGESDRGRDGNGRGGPDHHDQSRSGAGEHGSYRRREGPSAIHRDHGQVSNRGTGGYSGGRGGSDRGYYNRNGNRFREEYRGRGTSENNYHGRIGYVDNHDRPVEAVGQCNGLLPSDSRNEGNRSKMNQNLNPKLCINIFGLSIDARTVFRHVVQMKLIDHKTKKDYILTTMSARGRGNRASKQKDNFILLGKLLEKWTSRKPEKKNLPVFAYDGAQSLFTLEGISELMIIQKDDALEIPGISDFLKDSIKFLNGDLEISCEPDLEKPSFNQTDINEWSDPRFYAYLDIVTSQSAIRSGKYLSQSKGLYVNTGHQEELRVKWAVAAKGIHKGCRIVGSVTPLPILELDPQSTQYYAPIPLSQMIQYAFPRDFVPNRMISPNMRLQRAVKVLLKDLKCNPFYEDLADWATNTITVSDVDYNAPKDPEYRQKYPKLKFPNLPAAVCGHGPHKRLMPLEYLKVLPFQSIDRRVLEEFELTPRANAPNERWTTLQQHFEEFGFNDEVMQAFAVTICNDPFQNISEIDGERVLAPKINYADPVHVDDEKRDWKAQDKKFETPATINHLVVVLVAGYSRHFETEIKATEYVARAFMQRCNDKGMRIGNFEFKHHEGERESEHFLTSVFKNLVTHPKYRDPTFIPFVLFISDDVPNIHECLKFEERMSDIPTQHILLKNIRKIRDNIEKKSQGGRRAYDLTLDNIVMKANVKCGGLNYTADVPRDIGSWREVPTFVMGMDVAHPDKMATREGNPSTVGLSCNSADSPYSFIGDFLFTDPRREAIQDEILRKFTDQNVRNFADRRGFPRRIVIFRDGVSFGEETEALREVKIIEETCIAAARSMGFRDYAPKVLAIVVKKRHHTRFYAKGGNNGTMPINPLPDTSVGGDIAEYGKRQIFIQAFRPVQGTAKVPSFLIIRDDEEVTDEHITKMVCAVCSLHQLVNSPTSIPTPVYVAHELAKRGTGLFKAYRFKNGDVHDWSYLSDLLSYSTLDRLSKVRVV